MAISQEVRKDVWIWKQLNELLPDNAVREMKMLSDNKISFTLMKDLKDQNWIKYIDVIYHNVCGLVEDKEFDIK